MSLDCEIVETRLGAKAIRDRITGQLMHPVVGPAIEAERLYVGPSKLRARLEEDELPLVLLDAGLGAASNAIAAWRASEARARGRVLEIVSFDRSVAALALALEDRNAFGFEGDAGDAAAALIRDGAHETARTRWRLVRGDLVEALDAVKPLAADIVFWDPFSPRVNAELWTLRAFTSLRRHCGEHTTIHTYSRATSVRTAMALAGFAVGEGVVLEQGRATTIAATNVGALAQPLDARWIERLKRSSCPWPSDAPQDALERVAQMPQFAR